MNCITQQQPASSNFARECSWSKVQVDTEFATLYTGPHGDAALGCVPRLTRSGEDIYLRRLSVSGNRIRVQVIGAFRLNGEIGWIDEDAIESAGEKCPGTYSPN